MTYDTQKAIVAQNAATAAATILAGQPWNPDHFDIVRTHIFNGTLELAKEATAPAYVDLPLPAAAVPATPTDNVVTVFPGAQPVAAYTAPTDNVQASFPQPAPQEQWTPRPSAGGGNREDHGAGVVLKFGKHKGQTIAEAYRDDPEWVQWSADNASNDFVKSKCRDYLTHVS